MGMIPSWETSPTVGLIVYRAALPAGQTSEASVSVPMARGAYPADTPTAEPEEEPEGLCFVSRVLDLEKKVCL
jgi:hypothetical protein